MCQNRCRTDAKVEEVLSHELVHMYDRCTTNVRLFKRTTLLFLDKIRT